MTKFVEGHLKMRIKLTCVRHGEALHNIPKGERSAKPKFTDDGTLDSPLTPLGLQQIEKVGTRLADGKFDLAISSDLGRARDTCLAVTKHHPGLNLDMWKCARERRFGIIETKGAEDGLKILYCLVQVEDFIEDRSLLTWRMPEGGESVVDIRNRINQQFLPKLFAAARQHPGNDCSILFANHGAFLKELHRMFGDVAVSRTNFDNYDILIANTAVSSYEIDVDGDKITNVSCNFFNCKKHLE